MISFTKRSNPRRRTTNKNKIKDEFKERSNPSKKLNLNFLSLKFKRGNIKIKYPLIGGNFQLEDLKIV